MSTFDFRTVNLNLLPALDALLAEHSVGGAARRMGVSQSAMSHSLAKLRLLFDDPLLVPLGRGLTITPRGEQLQRELPDALRGLGRALAPPEVFDPATSTRSFRIATHDYFEFTALPDVLKYLARNAPGIRLHVERFGSTALGSLKAGEIDLLVTGVSARVPTVGLRKRMVFSDPFAVIVRQDHPRIGKKLSLRRYLEASHVLVSVDGRAEGVVDRVLRAKGLERHVALRVPNFVSAPLAVLASDMVSTVAEGVALQARRLLGLRVLPPPIDLPSAPIAAYWARQHDEDPPRAWFRNLFLEGHALSARTRRLMRAAQPA